MMPSPDCRSPRRSVAACSVGWWRWFEAERAGAPIRRAAMRRFGHLTRRILRGGSVAALLLLFVICLACVVSYFRTDTFGWAGFDDRSAQTWRNVGISSYAGEVV